MGRLNEASSILPLLSPHANSSARRQLVWQLNRFLTRRKLKFYLCLLVLLLILIITIVHRFSIPNTTINLSNIDGQHIKANKNDRNTRTMKTIIGKHIEPNAIAIQTLSDELLNSNNYNPDPNMGRDGRPAYPIGYSKEHIQLMFQINRLNLVVSDKIPVDRKLPDVRKTACRRIHHKINDLPNTSVIIVFHNEAWSTLIRTVHSILNTSPQHLLAEILLVDDASNRTFLEKSLDYYINNLSSVRGVDIRILRSTSRIGLIRARLMGAEVSKGKVLTFVDAHCEATTGWLEPLLAQIKLNRKIAACPIIDIINEDNFAYTRSFELHIGALNWSLNFRWYPISKRELIASNNSSRSDGKVRIDELINPFNSPIMAGGLFSIEREYFNEIGRYDPHMDIWGGENIELSLRLWQCGGQVKIVPCSHVGHIFRKSSPYTFRPGKQVSDILYSNLARVSEVWMDDWRHLFYLTNPLVNKTLAKIGRETALIDIEARKQLRKDLKCKNFEWFLNTVWPEHFFPNNERFFGKIKQDITGKCLQKPILRGGPNTAPVGAIQMARCSTKLMTHQLFVFNEKTGFLMTDENVCLDSGSDPRPTRQVILAPCSESQRQRWKMTGESRLKHVQSGLCLESSNSERVQLEDCTKDKASMKWTLVHEDWRPLNQA